MIQSQTFTCEVLGQQRLNFTVCLALRLAVVITIMLAVAAAYGQDVGFHQEMSRQIPAPLPKLALIGGAKTATPIRKVVLTITNWERYPGDMFQVRPGTSLPPNPCSQSPSRIVISVYSERGDLLAGCIAVPGAADLGRFGFLIPKGKPVPEFLYAVVSDRYTGAAYRSNLVSLSNSASKWLPRPHG